MGKLFKTLRWIFQRVMHKMDVEWAEAFIDEPCVFVCNHIGAMGPIHMCGTFPLNDQIRLWCNDGVLEARLTPEYVRHDFWWNPRSLLAPLYNVTLPYIAAAIIPPILRSAPTIPVHHDARIMTTMRQSLRALKEGQHIVIFPEKPDGYESYAREISTGWLNLCTMYRKMAGKELRIYPVHIDTRNHAYRIARPVMVDAARPLEEQEPELNRILGAGLRGECISE